MTDKEIEPRKRLFKILLWNDRYVDEMLLHRGLYIAIKPELHDFSETKENMVEKYKQMARIAGVSNSEYISNLMLCELVEIELMET